MTADRTRVLQLIKGLGPGGAERLIVNHLASGDHARFDYEVAYLVAEKRHLVPEIEALDVAVHRLDGTAITWATGLRALVRDRGIDVVHVHSPLVAAIARVALRTLGRGRPSIIYTEHNRWPRHARATRALNRCTINLNDETIAVSEDVRSTMPRHLEDRIEVLVHGVDRAEVTRQAVARQEVRAELGIGADELVVGIVANFRREKAYDVLLEAATMVIEACPNVRFVSVGQGPLEADVRVQHDLLGLGDRFRLLGYRADAVRVMSAFDVYTMSSHHEGLPVSLMDAMTLGLPTVATAVGGIPEAVRHGVEGLLVPPRRPALLAAALAQMCRDQDLRAAMGVAASERSRRYDASVAARRLESIYLG